MNKIIALILALTLCLSLTACGSKTGLDKTREQVDQDKTREQVDQLIEQENVEEIARILAEDPDCLRLAALQEKFIRHGMETVAGTWKNLQGTETWELEADGTMTVRSLYDPDPREMTWRFVPMDVDVDGIHTLGLVEYGGIGKNVTEENGVFWIGMPGEFYSLIREEDLAGMTETVEITMDNWQEYFDVRENVVNPNVDDTGMTQNLTIYTVFVLKPEFEEKLLSAEGAFEITANKSSSYQTDWTPNMEGNTEYTLTGGKSYEVSGNYMTGVFLNAKGMDERYVLDVGGSVYCAISLGRVQEGEAWLLEGPVTNVKGTLTLFK